MCDMCDGMTREESLAKMRGFIEKYGWGVQAVEGSGGHPDWAYTVGLTLHGHPELVVTGMAMQPAGHLLNRYAEHVMHAEDPVPGEQVPLVDGPLVEFVELQHPDAHLHTANGLFGRGKVRAVQMVWADERGRWPWSREFRDRRGGQPVLGARARAG